MDKELAKSLVSLIDETIAEIEDLKKSRFSAAEVNMEKAGTTIAGHPTSGSIVKQDDDDDDDDDDDMDKGENESADPGTRGVTPPSEASVPPKSNLHSEATKAEYDDDEDDEDREKKKKKKMMMDKGENESADPGTRGVTPPSEASVPAKSNLHSEATKAEQPATGYDIKKSLETQETLMKSYIDDKVGGLEKKLESIITMVKEIGDQPVARKSVSARMVPLTKNDDGEPQQPLSKTVVANKLLELKKSGQNVDSGDIAMVEMGAGSIQAIVDKYGLN